MFGVRPVLKGLIVNKYIILHVGHTTKHHEHIQFWAPESKGYVVCIDKAGRYSEDEARRICKDSSESIAVPDGCLDSIVRTTPYYAKNNGSLAKFYDGDYHRPIRNSKDDWKIILQQSGLIGKCKPTPSKAFRSVYIS
jgi:hypothetical protein